MVHPYCHAENPVIIQDCFTADDRNILPPFILIIVQAKQPSNSGDMI